jgi:adenosylcobyric acid synthase
MSGKLFVVGIGPGALEHLTPAAQAAIAQAEVVAGYQTYLDLIPQLLVGKQLLSSGMMQEVERCRQVLAMAASGRTVALVSSGDSGIYGMAGLVLELAEAFVPPFGKGGAGGISPAGSSQIPLSPPLSKGDLKAAPLQDLEIEIIPGVSAVQAAAARLGAPLMHDFAVISLSDLLTPWELIRRRLEAAAGADFVVALYNPKSRGRSTQIGEARDILLCQRSPQTPVGLVRNACRAGEEVTVSDLVSFAELPIDMFTTVIIGNSQTRVDGQGRMVTPRGYETRSTFNVRRSTCKSLNFEPRTSNLEPAPKAHALFVGGTGSDVGKSVIAAGLCRLLARRGLRVAPFKAQNMALNSAVTPEGGEIGRAQALQAAACGIAPHTDMNPILLKPNSDTGSQVVVQGRPLANMDVRQYHAFKEEAFARVRESYQRLAAAYQVIVLEGAGSIAEINLRQHDIVNLRAAAMAEAPVLLVADIDRGGVFAAIVGTIELLEPDERARLAGVVINKFRGDASLLRSGIEAVQTRTGVPVLGVVPWLKLQLPEEDSLGLTRQERGGGAGEGLRIGVVKTPRLSNYTDFDPLAAVAGVTLSYLEEPAEVAGLDLLILPGSKATLADLQYMHQHGWSEAIHAYHAAAGMIVGICGGYQMLGRMVHDPHGLESPLRQVQGLGLLDVETVLQPHKETHQTQGVFHAAAAVAGLPVGEPASGYEIHHGVTTRSAQQAPLLRLTRRGAEPIDLEDGAISADGRVWGTYLHGLFDEGPARAALLAQVRQRRGLRAQAPGSNPDLDAELDRLADHLQAHLDLPVLWRRLGLPATGGAA